jgi:hypothetical protein
MSVRRLAVAAVVLASGAFAIGGALGMVVGLAGAGVFALARPRSAVAPVKPDDVPVVVDLVAGCLAAGAGLPDALDAAAVAADDVMRAACCGVAAALRAGAPPEEAWQAWLADPWLAPVARTAVRTTQSGAAAAADLRRTSSRLRARRRAAAQHRVQQASVWLVVPLGLCFLPAFVLVVGAALSGVAVMTAQLRCVDAADIAARMAARGDSAALVRSAALRGAPGSAAVDVVSTAGLVTATVRARLSLPGLSSILPAVVVQAHVTEALEPAPPTAFDPESR